jgi:hypothetical protein
MFEPVTKQKLIKIMLESACKFIEDYSEPQLRYYRIGDCVKGLKPVKFQPSSADKMIIRKLAEREAELIPENYRNDNNAEILGQRVIVYYYWPLYNDFNRFQEPQ